MKLLMRFLKGPEVRYISHLDIQRLFQRAVRRAKIPADYSKGFHPHMLLGFAGAMPLGLCSRGEYMEVQLEAEMEPQEAMRRLNEVLPPGVQVLACRKMAEGEAAVGARMVLAKYSLYLEKPQEAEAVLAAFLAKEEILLEKKTKKGMAKVNVRPMIRELFLEDEKITAVLACSNAENLRADKLADLLRGEGLCIGQVWRESIFTAEEGRLAEPIGIEA